jgi:hypothetical protein
MKLKQQAINKYTRAHARYHAALKGLAVAEAELFKPGTEVRWNHGNYWRSGQVVMYAPGILQGGKVKVLSRAGKEQWVSCSQVLLGWHDVTHTK